MTEKSAKHFKMTMTDAEHASIMANLTPERRLQLWLDEAQRIAGQSIAVRLPKSDVERSIRYYADNDLGIEPEITSDADFAAWTASLVQEHGSYEDGAVAVSLDGDSVVIRGPMDLPRIISLYLVT